MEGNASTLVYCFVYSVVYMPDGWLACVCHCSPVMAHVYFVILCYAWLVLYHKDLRMLS